MLSNFFIYLVIAVLVAHFLFAVGYLIYKIMKAPKSSDNMDNSSYQNSKQKDSSK